MHEQQTKLRSLAERVGRGDQTVTPELRRRLEEALGPVVRRALRGRGNSPMAEAIRDTSRRASLTGGGSATAAAVVSSLCARAVDSLQARAESVVPAQFATVTL
jgi:hypothetical protein